jgi:sulfide:quinone oxidoreductase
MPSTTSSSSGRCFAVASTNTDGFRVVVCGGGIAASEAMLRLRRVLGDELGLTLIAPNEELVYRPLAVREPFAFQAARRYPLRRLAADTDADWLKDALQWVDPGGQEVHTSDGRTVPYDALLVAIGARSEPAFDHATTFSDAEADATFQGVIQDIEDGYTKELALLVPEGATWPLPVYELALLTAERAYGMGFDDVRLSIVTPEPSPLAAFGKAASDAVGSLLEQARVTVYPSARAEVPAAREVVVWPEGVELEPGRIVAMPRLVGPGVRGLPGEDGFISIDEACRVPGTGDRAFAAGDAAAFPIKHGGLGAQEADVAAAGIARVQGVNAEPERFEPTIRAILLTGKQPLYFVARHAEGDRFESQVFDEPQWDPPEKLAAEELGPYLIELDAKAERPRV